MRAAGNPQHEKHELLEFVKRANRHAALAFTGAGFAFAAIVGVMAYLGHLADEKLGTDPWLLVVGAMLGVALATWDLIRTANAVEARRRKGDE
jgi:F0F1-type ATP synthase assembly protein I